MSRREKLPENVPLREYVRALLEDLTAGKLGGDDGLSFYQDRSLEKAQWWVQALYDSQNDELLCITGKLDTPNAPLAELGWKYDPEHQLEARTFRPRSVPLDFDAASDLLCDTFLHYGLAEGSDLRVDSDRYGDSDEALETEDGLTEAASSAPEPQQPHVGRRGWIRRFLGSVQEEQKKAEEERRAYAESAAAIEQAWIALLTLSPSDFEFATARILEALGFLGARRVGGSGDLGVDVVTRDEVGQLVAVQCERYAPQRSVASPAIQHLIGMATVRGANRILFATTAGSFTAPARALAAAHGVELLDGEQLAVIYARVLAGAEARPEPEEAEADRLYATERTVESASLEALGKDVERASNEGDHESVLAFMLAMRQLLPRDHPVSDHCDLGINKLRLAQSRESLLQTLEDHEAAGTLDEARPRGHRRSD